MLIILRIGQYLDRFSGRFLPVQGYEELDTQRRAQMFVLAHQLSPLIAFGLAGLLYAAAGVASIPLLALSLGFASFYVYPFLLKRVLSFHVASFLSTGQLTILVLLFLYFYGGLSSFALPWIATIPILGTLYLGLRGAYPSTLIAAIGLLALFVLHWLGRDFDDPIPADWRDTVLMASIGLCILFNTGVLFLHTSLYQSAQRALRERGALLTLAQKLANVWNWEFDYSTRRLFWSPEICRMFGPEMSQFNGTQEQFLSFVHSDDKASVEERTQELALGGAYGFTFRILRPGGEERTVNLQGELMRNADGTPRRAQGFMQDITERKQTELALRKVEERFRGIFDQAAVGIGLMSPGGRFLMVNQKLCNLMNRSEEELLQLRFAQFIDPGDLVAALQNIAKLISGEVETYSQIICYAPEAGKVMWGNLTVSLIREGGSDRFALLGIVEDITERRQAEEQLLQAQKMEAVGQLTGGVAHDFNNLLSIIIGNLDLLGEDIPGSGKQREYLANALHGAERAASLTHRLLAFSRTQPLTPTVIDVNTLLKDMAHLMYRSLGEAIEVHFALAEALLGVRADANQLESAVLNLAINARDAMPEGGKLTVASATVELDKVQAAHEEAEPGKYVEISISDTGQGIPKAELEHVIEPFYTTKEVGQGSGLGLSMVFGFIKQSGGHLKIASRLGEGTRVTLYLPAVSGVEPEASDTRGSELQEVARGNEQLILVVEDDPDLRIFTERTLEDLGYEFLSAADAHRALELLEENPQIQLMFSDVVLPGGMNGVELWREAERRHGNLKVLFTSGYMADALPQYDLLNDGVMELLPKPYRKPELARRIAALLEPD